MKTTVRQLLDEKGHEIHSVAPDSMVFDAIQKMGELGIGALLVLQGGKIVGIVTERDYTRKIVLQNRSSRSTPVHDIMTAKVLYMSPEQSVEESMVLMSKHSIRHMPVIEGDQVIGVLSIKDVMKHVIMEKDFVINQLEKYISGSA